MGMLLMRAACSPEEDLLVGQVSLPPLRAILLHAGLDLFSNRLPPPGAIGIEKLLSYVGPALLVAAVRPQARELLSGVASGSLGWRQVFEFARAAM